MGQKGQPLNQAVSRWSHGEGMFYVALAVQNSDVAVHPAGNSAKYTSSIPMRL
jgi:hypothetical protein